MLTRRPGEQRCGCLGEGSLSKLAAKGSTRQSVEQHLIVLYLYCILVRREQQVVADANTIEYSN